LLYIIDEKKSDASVSIRCKDPLFGKPGIQFVGTVQTIYELKDIDVLSEKKCLNQKMGPSV
jgi:hypothetical protein